MLAAMGLKTLHETVYEAMLRHPSWGVDELVAQLDLTESEVRAALDDLFELRLVRRSFEHTDRLLAVAPEMGLRTLLERQHDELLRQQRQMAERQASISRMITHIAARPVTAAQGDGSEQILGMDAIQRRLERLAEEATEEICTFMSGGAQAADSLEAARRNDARLLARGVTTRTIGLDSIRDHGPTLEHARWLTSLGGEFRTAPSLPPRMILADRRAALVPLDPDNTRKGVLWLTGPGVIASLTALFDQAWNQSTPLGADDPAPRPGLSEAERALLHLIGQGHTDEAAAGKLHISPRTARRMMAAIMERLEARSRFEAGLKAAQQGWL